MLTPLLLLNLALPSEPIWQKLPTPGGNQMEVHWLAPVHEQAPILIVAPGQSCNARRSFFEAIETASRQQGIGLLRLEWSYCGLAEDKRQPSEDLGTEVNDIQTALSWLSTQSKGHSWVLAGKSLGSLVSYKAFQSQTDLKALALLTPVCSYAQDEKGQTLNPPQNKLAEHYPGLAQIQQPILFSLGNQDALCHLPYLYQSLQNSPANITLQTFGGGHSLNLLGPDRQEDSVATARNQSAFATALVNWAWLATR